MGIIVNIDEAVKNSYYNVLQEPIKFVMDREVESFEKNSIINKVYVMKTSNTFREEYRSVTAMDGFKPTEDMEPAGISDFEEGYNKQFVFQTWTNSYVISKQTIEDKTTGNLEPSAVGFIQGYNRTRERYAVRMLGAALGHDYAPYKITAVSGTGMDTVDGTVAGVKQQYFHNQHKPVGYGAADRTFTQSNKFYTELAFDGTDPVLEEKVIDVIEQVAAKMRTAKDDKGNILTCDPDTILMAEDYLLNSTVERALKSRFGSRMDGNGVNLMYGKYKVIISPDLAEVQGFQPTEHGLILLDSKRNRVSLGAVWIDRVPLQIESYIDKKTKANFWDGRARFVAGFGDHRVMSYINFGGQETANADPITPIAAAVTPVNVVNTTKAPVNTKEVVA